MAKSWVKVELPAYNLWVGSVEPLERVEQHAWLNQNVKAIINVTDSPYFTFEMSSWIKTGWFPIDEYVKWPIASLFGAKRMLDYCCISARLPTFIHCSGGVCRSRCMVALWLHSRGFSFEQSCASVKLEPDALNTLLDRGKINLLDLKILTEASKSSFSLCGIRQYVEGDGNTESQDFS